MAQSWAYYSRMGALPSFAVPGDLDGMAGELLNLWLNSTPSGSPAGNIRALISRANEIQTAAAPVFAHSAGATAASTAASLEAGLNQGWADLVQNARVTSAIHARRPEFTLGPRPGWPAVGAGQEWDVARDAYVKSLNDWTADLGRQNRQRDSSLGPALGSQLIKYVTSVPDAMAAVQRLIDAERAKKTAEVVADVVKTEGDTIISRQRKVRAEADLIKADTELGKAKKEAKAAASAIGGVSPVVIAAVALPLLGAALYFLTRKKGGAVGGYRQRRRSRR